MILARLCFIRAGYTRGPSERNREFKPFLALGRPRKHDATLALLSERARAFGINRSAAGQPRRHRSSDIELATHARFWPRPLDRAGDGRRLPARGGHAVPSPVSSGKQGIGGGRLAPDGEQPPRQVLHVDRRWQTAPCRGGQNVASVRRRHGEDHAPGTKSGMMRGSPDPSPKGDDSGRRYLRFWGSNVRADVDDEIAFHLERLVNYYISCGVDPEEARRIAALRFGDRSAIAST